MSTEDDIKFVDGHWLPDAQRWCDLWRVPIAGDSVARLYKVTGMDHTTGTDYDRKTFWRVGSTVTCGDDWEPVPVCGGGLHLWPTLDAAVEWAAKDLLLNQMQSRIFYVEANVADLVPIPWPHLSRVPKSKLADWTYPPWAQKAKVPSCKVLREVNGQEVWTLTYWYAHAAQERRQRSLHI
jgi:hypothetical protein